MANRGTKRSTSKNTKKRTSSNRNSRNNNETQYRDEIILIVVLLCSILLLLSMFNLCGFIGAWFKNFLIGLMGIMAYIFPFLLLLIFGFYLSNKRNIEVKKKLFYGMAVYIDLMAFFQWISGIHSDKLLEYYQTDELLSGGLIGGLLNHGLQFLFGKVGACLILIAVFLIFFVLLTGKMIFSSLRDYYEENQEKNENDVVIQEVFPLKKEKRKLKTFTFPKMDKKDEEKTDEGPIESSKEGPIEIIRSDASFPEAESKETPAYQEELENKFRKIQIEHADDPIVEQMDPVVEEVKPDLVSHTKKPVAEDENLGTIEVNVTRQKYIYPSLNLLSRPKKGTKGMSDRELMETAEKLKDTLDSFGVHVKMGNVSCGPSVTRYELQPEQGVKVSRITGLADDIKLNLAAADIRIEAPIPGKSAVGIEVPNKENKMVTLRELLENPVFQENESKIAFAVGKDISGKTIVTDIAKMPHLLIAGATGSGKSVCINTLIMSILYKADPNDVKLIMVDPKVVELSVYNGIPHLLIPVVTDPKKASAALNWAVAEMTDRYKKFAELGVRDMSSYNERVSKVEKAADEGYVKMPQIVIIVDELADLMMVAPGEVEDAICRLAQMARAAGLHLILATQRPSVNVITGLIKANVPSRIAFAVSSAIDSRTILDGSGAEKLLGKGDMLFFPSGYPKPVRIQGAFVSDKEVSSVVDFLKRQNDEPMYNESITSHIDSNGVSTDGSAGTGLNDRDEYFIEVGKFIIEKDKASIGMLQRVFRIGFNRAARIMDQLCEAGVVGEEEGTKPRKVLMSIEQFENMIEEEG